MKELPEKPRGSILSEKVEEIMLRAVEMSEFIDIVKSAPDKLKAITRVRLKLRELFPEIENLPELIPGRVTASNEFFIAKEIVRRLSE